MSVYNLFLFWILCSSFAEAEGGGERNKIETMQGQMTFGRFSKQILFLFHYGILRCISKKEIQEE